MCAGGLYFKWEIFHPTLSEVFAGKSIDELWIFSFDMLNLLAIQQFAELNAVQSSLEANILEFWFISGIKEQTQHSDGSVSLALGELASHRLQ